MKNGVQTEGSMHLSHAEMLETLARGNVSKIKALAEGLIEPLGSIEVLSSQTGLALLPYSDPVQNAAFHLGEVLVAEAHIRLPDKNAEGYGAVTGRDLEHAMAIAVIDASLSLQFDTARIMSLIEAEYLHALAVDKARLQQIEATRVRMETA